jgi:hypothetical protein
LNRTDYLTREQAFELVPCITAELAGFFEGWPTQQPFARATCLDPRLLDELYDRRQRLFFFIARGPSPDRA